MCYFVCFTGKADTMARKRKRIIPGVEVFISDSTKYRYTKSINIHKRHAQDLTEARLKALSDILECLPHSLYI
jgi:hypothetical protein